MEESIYQENKLTLNICVANKSLYKYMKQELGEIEEMTKSVIVEDFDILYQ